MCVCVCVCVCVYIYPYMYIHAALVDCVFVCVEREIQAHARERVCARTCDRRMCARVRVCVCVLAVHACVRACACVRVRTCVRCAFVFLAF